MSKLRYKILGFIIAFITICSFSFTTINTCYAQQTENYNQDVEQVVLELEQFLEINKTNEDKTRENRTPGSVGEYNSAVYIKQVMNSLSTFKPVTNLTTKDGIQSFEFKNLTLDKKMTSQNVIFRKDTNSGSTKKIIISTHYDASYVKESNGKLTFNQSVNESAASVAALISLAKKIDKSSIDLGFNVEIIFFGAGTNAYDGSKFYVEGISKSAEKDILLMINFDKIALGENSYYYVNEFETSQQKYYQKVFERNKNLSILNTNNLVAIPQESINGLEYSHLGLESNHAYFMKRNINTLLFMSGFYEQYLTFGVQEYSNKESVTYTDKDNYQNIVENYDNYGQNLANIVNFVYDLINDKDFAGEMQKDNNLSAKYAFWTNQKIVVLITMALFLVSLVIYYIIYHILNKKSKQAAKNANVNQIVFKISSNMGSDDSSINELIDKKVKDDTKSKNKQEKDKQE